MRSICDIHVDYDAFRTALTGLNFGTVQETWHADDQGIQELTHIKFRDDKTSRIQYNDGSYSYTIQSSTDGYCAFNAIAACVGSNNLDLTELKTFMDAKAGSDHQGGFKIGAYSRALHKSGITVLHASQFYKRFSQQSLSTYSTAKREGYRMTPALLYDDHHAYLCYDPRASAETKRPVRNLDKLITDINAVDESAPVEAPLIIKKDKRADNKRIAPADDRVAKSIACAIYTLQTGYTNLPVCAENHRLGCNCARTMAYWVFNRKYGGKRVPAPEVKCKGAARAFATAFKRRFPEFF